MSTLTYRTAGNRMAPQLIALIEGPPRPPRRYRFITPELRRRHGRLRARGRDPKDRNRHSQILSGALAEAPSDHPIAPPIVSEMIPAREAPRRVHRRAPPRAPGFGSGAVSIQWPETDCREIIGPPKRAPKTAAARRRALASFALLNNPNRRFAYALGDSAGPGRSLWISSPAPSNASERARE